MVIEQVKKSFEKIKTSTKKKKKKMNDSGFTY